MIDVKDYFVAVNVALLILSRLASGVGDTLHRKIVKDESGWNTRYFTQVYWQNVCKGFCGLLLLSPGL